MSSRVNYACYASGRVIYGLSGASNFSIRLSVQVFDWCIAYLASHHKPGPYLLYDPFCGIAYALTVLGFLYPHHIKGIIASDIDERALQVARKNLGLLTASGLGERIAELQLLSAEYNKLSHQQALADAVELQRRLPVDIQSNIFTCDIMNYSVPATMAPVDILFTDVPYGELTVWQGSKKDNSFQQFLNNVKGILAPHAVVVIAYHKKQTIVHEGYIKLKSFKSGLRKVIILAPCL